ncbi:hypothetical protein D9756_006189 [Leucocoprinus leucothites]|uniref:RNA-dependent RNA polymerase n=1 Tax=Leucocoprinus leucothites TaxID=201217 RepID=A0A8H5D2L8_9AGAR|nr:hypothetical protein D9756_006189 [Leucoagaricus leucothites]
MSPRKSRQKQPTSSVSNSDGSEYGAMLDSGWWDEVEKSPDVQRHLNSPQKSQRVDEFAFGSSSSSSSSLTGNSSSPRDTSTRQSSQPVPTAGQVEAHHPTLFPINGAGLRLESIPITPKKHRAQHEPPSTGGRTAIANGISRMSFTSPSKPGKGTAPPRQQPTSTTQKQPRKTVLLTVSDDEEDEVNDMLAGDDSPTSTQPSPLFPGPRATLGQESWTSWEEGPSNRKRPRSSDSSDIEVEVRLPGKPNLLDSVSVISRNAKVRKESPRDSPTKLAPLPMPLTFSLAPDTPYSVGLFFDESLGTNLVPFYIAHSKKAQELMDKLRLSWGVQYELARGVTLQEWSWNEVYNALDQKPMALAGSNADAAVKVRALMKDRAVPRDANTLLWKELDREQAAILENVGRGLGLMGEWDGQENWYGGRVQQIARLSKTTDEHGYHIHLEAMEKRRSHRFARFCGSRRILQLRIPKKLILDEGVRLKEFFQQKFILCGRVFIPFHAKDHSLYMVEINEDWERRPQNDFGDHKYVTRFALGLSTTVPALEFKENNMFLIDDIYGNEYEGGSPSAEETMTDGCGLINQAALVMVNSQLNRQSLPVALQGRIAGAKGLWLLHPTDESPEPKIWVRASQNKIKHPHLHRSHRIFELVAPSHPSNSVSISRQSIVNLSFNGVPDEVLLACVEKGLTDEIEPLLKWNHPQVSLHLWNAINKNGSVARSRLSRATAGISRALGLTRRVWTEDDDEEEVIDFDEDKSADTGRNEYSGAPLGLHESALELLQAGFHPLTFKSLRDKVQTIVEQTIKTYVESFRIHLPESLGGFVVPDPLGVLEEGEVYYRSSQPLVDPRTQRDFHTLTGNVILGRYPIRLASDMQKVAAVDKPELFPWPDVIIISTKGPRSLASLLSGGDMDGDELFIIREAELVEPFQNKPFVAGPPDLLEKNFQKHVETVSQFCERVKFLPPAKSQSELQKALLLSLSGDRKGLYSKFHDNAIEKYGYNSREAIRLAYMFNTLLDASKSGLILAEGVFERDQKMYGGKFKDEDDYPIGDPDASKKVTPPTTNPSSHMYILTRLQERAQKTGAEVKKKNAPELPHSIEKRDIQLIRPYEDASNFAHSIWERERLKLFEDDMTRIREHVRRAFEEFKKASMASMESKSKESKSGKKKNKKGSSSNDEANFRRVAMLFAEPIEGISVTPNVEEIKASYAYSEWHTRQFPLGVAFKQLCEIKARASKGGIVPCIREIDEMKTIPGSCIRALEKSYADWGVN